MNRAVGHLDDIGLAILVERIQVRAVLKEIGVELLVVHGQIRLHVVVEDTDVQVNALRFQLGFDELQNLGVRNRRRRD